MKKDEYELPGCSAWPFERKCPECGKIFSGTMIELWNYRDGQQLLCSWGCMRKREKRREEKEESRKKKLVSLHLTPKQKEVVIRKYINRGMTNEEISDLTGFSRQQINYYRKKTEGGGEDGD